MKNNSRIFSVLTVIIPAILIVLLAMTVISSRHVSAAEGDTFTVSVVSDSGEVLKENVVRYGFDTVFIFEIDKHCTYLLEGDCREEYDHENRTLAVFVDKVTENIVIKITFVYERLYATNVNDYNKNLYRIEFEDGTEFGERGERKRFKITVADSHNKSDRFVVKANTEVLTLSDDGFYEVVLNDIINISVLNLLINRYTVRLITKDGVQARSEAVHGNGLSFNTGSNGKMLFVLEGSGSEARFEDSFSKLVIDGVSADGDIFISENAGDLAVSVTAADGLTVENDARVIPYGGEFVTELTIEDGYKITHKPQNVTIENGILKISNITEHTHVTVAADKIGYSLNIDIPEENVSVVFESGVNIAKGQNTVYLGDKIIIRIKPVPGYDDVVPQINAEGAELTEIDAYTFLLTILNGNASLTLDEAIPNEYAVVYRIYLDDGDTTVFVESVENRRKFGLDYALYSDAGPEFAVENYYNDNKFIDLFAKDTAYIGDLTVYVRLVFAVYKIGLDMTGAEFKGETEFYLRYAECFPEDKFEAALKPGFVFQGLEFKDVAKLAVDVAGKTLVNWIADCTLVPRFAAIDVSGAENTVYNGNYQQNVFEVRIGGVLTKNFTVKVYDGNGLECAFKNAGTYRAVVAVADSGLGVGSTEFLCKIKKAKLTVEAADVMFYENEKFPELKITYSGFVGGEDENNLTAAPLLENPPSSVGQHESVLSGGISDNYEFVYKIFTVRILNVLSPPPGDDGEIPEEPLSAGIIIAVLSGIASVSLVAGLGFAIRGKRKKSQGRQ